LKVLNALYGCQSTIDFFALDLQKYFGINEIRKQGKLSIHPRISSIAISDTAWAHLDLFEKRIPKK
jgi:hypothetical protein